MDMNIEEELKKVFLGDITSDIVLKREILREVVWRQASWLSVGTKVIPERIINVLDLKYHLPSDITVEHGIPEGAAGKRTEAMEWTTFSVSLEKAEGSIVITDEAIARQAIGLSVFPTKDPDYADTALLGIAGEATAMHLVAGPGTPGLVMTEEKREGTSTIYTVRQYFQTKVIPESATDARNKRLAKIINVTA